MDREQRRYQAQLQKKRLNNPPAKKKRVRAPKAPKLACVPRFAIGDHVKLATYTFRGPSKGGHWAMERVPGIISAIFTGNYNTYIPQPITSSAASYYRSSTSTYHSEDFVYDVDCGDRLIQARSYELQRNDNGITRLMRLKNKS